MAMLVKSKGGNFVPPPADVHNAICVGVYDIGTQVTNFGEKRQFVIIWELDCLKKDNSRYTISSTYGFSLHKKAGFRKLLESWSGREVTPEEEKNGFDVAKLLGKPCSLQVIHKESNGDTYANVGAVMKLMAGLKPLQPTTKMATFSFDDNGKNIPDGVPEWIQKKIKASSEWTGSTDTGEAVTQFDTETVESQASATF